MEQWLHSSSKVEEWEMGEGHSVSFPRLSGFKGLLLQALPFYIPILTIHNVKSSPRKFDLG